MDFDGGRLPGQLSRMCEIGMSSADFRVPLDVPRVGVRTLPWRPLLLADHVVSGQVGMLELLRDLHRTLLPSMTRPVGPLPVLVDVNLWYRTVKLVYGREAQRWTVGEALGRMPPLYAVWHPYKQVVHEVYRRHLSLLHFVKDGTVAVGRRWRSYPDLQTMERWLGALLRLPEDRRERLRGCLRRYHREIALIDSRLHRAEERRGECEAALARVNAHVRDELMDAARTGADGYLRRSTERHLAQARRQLAEVGEEIQRLEAWRRRRAADLPVLQSFADLVFEWAPACLLLGYYIRQCAWDQRTPGTGWLARQALQLSLCLLVRLEGWAGQRRMSEYVRTLACALVSWTPWHDGVPGCCFVEEANEAALSRLGALLERHPQATTTADAMDLYLLVDSGRTDRLRNLPAGNVGERWYEQALGHVDELLRFVDHRPQTEFGGSTSKLVTYIAHVRVTGEMVAEGAWPTEWTVPVPPNQPYLNPRLATDLMQHALRTLVRDSPPDEATVVLLDDLCPRRSAEELHRRQMLCDTVVPATGRSGGRTASPIRPFLVALFVKRRRVSVSRYVRSEFPGHADIFQKMYSRTCEILFGSHG